MAASLFITACDLCLRGRCVIDEHQFFGRCIPRFVLCIYCYSVLVVFVRLPGEAAVFVDCFCMYYRSRFVPYGNDCLLQVKVIDFSDSVLYGFPAVVFPFFRSAEGDVRGFRVLDNSKGLFLALVSCLINRVCRDGIKPVLCKTAEGFLHAAFLVFQERFFLSGFLIFPGNRHIYLVRVFVLCRHSYL